MRQSLARQPHVLVAIAVCTVLVASALSTGYFIKEALEERQVESASIGLRLASQTVTSADALRSAEIEASLPLVEAIGVLEADRDLALHSLSDSDRRHAEELLDEIAEDGLMLLSSGTTDHAPHSHDEVEEILTRASTDAAADAALAERLAALSLLVAAVAAGVAGWLLIRSRTSETRLRRELTRQANTDLLTGLPNRRALAPALDSARAGMESAGAATALIFLDLDGFKDINDTLGHNEGDGLLTRVAARLTEAQKAGDFLVRLGGDEFAVLVPNVGGPDQAEATAHRYLEALDAPFEVDGRPEQLRTSIGVTVTTDPTNVARLAAEADVAMYEAKRNGGNAVAIFNRSMEARSDETSRITRALRAADHDAEFSIVYQPIVTVDGGDTLGFEALLRWTSPTLGLVGPNEFIPVAERSGEICSIGLWVLESVCDQIRAWDEQGLHQQRSVSINVSPLQLEDDGFVDAVLRTLASRDVTPSRLVVEVTESAVLDHRGIAPRCLGELRRAGLRVSIDDFGSGYSNLGQLLQVPFDVIKIDRSLLLTMTAMREAAGGDPTGPCAIMGAIVSIAGVFDAAVVCEGVETEAQRGSLEASGVTYVQGYLTGRPVPPDELPSGSDRATPAVERPRPISLSQPVPG